MNKSQNGFGVVVILAVVLVVGMAGFIGWFVFSKTANKPGTSNAAQVNTQVSSNNSQASSQTPQDQAQPATSRATTMTVKEWGVKIQLHSLDAGAYYELNKNFDQSTTDPNYLVVYAPGADELKGPTGVSCKGEYIAFLMRLPSYDPRWQPSKAMDDGNVSDAFKDRETVGAYRYAVATFKQYGPTCFATTATGDYYADPTTFKKFTDVANAFVTDFKNIKAE